MQLNIIILAAGKGTRMKSDLPKVLQHLANKPLLQHVLETSGSAIADSDEKRVVIVHGHGAELVRTSVEQWNNQTPIAWALQEPQLGTGHAVHCALPHVSQSGYSLVLYGDVPLVQPQTLSKLISAAASGAALLTMFLEEPKGYGRIVRELGRITRIVEEKDASDQEKRIKEVNTGILCVRSQYLHELIPLINNHNAQKEYYLTDLIGLLCGKDIEVQSVHPDYAWEVEGVNDKLQLAELERKWQRYQANRLMLQGLGLADPNRFDLRGTLVHGKDCFIDIGTIIEGDVRLGNRVRIGAHCHIKDCILDDDVDVRPMTMMEQAHLAQGSQVGPFARLRPGTHLGVNVHIGNFVEVKNCQIAEETKAGHLSYLGDAEIGRHVNIGAGTIICNYDGARKHQTQIEDEVFIGSNTALVAPVRIAAGATTAAGSVIHKDVPPGQLAVARGRQTHIENWKRPVKNQDQS